MSKPIYKMTHGAIGEAMCCYTDGSYKDADIALTEYEEKIRADEREKIIEIVKNLKDSVPVNRVLDDIINDKPKELGMLIAYDNILKELKEQNND